MAEPYIGEIRLFPFGRTPKGWAPCNGQILPIQGNQALYAVIGKTYGGDGVTNFALPNLQGRAAVSTGQGAGLSSYTPGQVGGEETHTLTFSELPSHTHTVSASNQPVSQPSPEGNVWGTTGPSMYAPPSNAAMAPAALASAGAGQGHPNMQPYTTLNFCIAIQGYFPPHQ